MITSPALLCRLRKLSIGKIIVMQKHQIGTPFFVTFLRNFGACPSMDNAWSVLLAQYTYELPAEKMLVTIKAFVMCGRTPIPKFCMAIT